MIIIKKKTAFFNKLALLLLVFGIACTTQQAKAQRFYSNPEGSQIKISSKSKNVETQLTNDFSCKGDFIMQNGELQNLSALNFTLPANLQKKEELLIETHNLGTTKPTNDIKFELTHSMVLPKMNMVHIIGYLDIEGVKKRVDFQLEFIENNDDTITIMGQKSLRLSEFKKGADFAIFKKNDEKIQIDFKLVIKNTPKANYIAAASVGK